MLEPLDQLWVDMAMITLLVVCVFAGQGVIAAFAQPSDTAEQSGAQELLGPPASPLSWSELEDQVSASPPSEDEIAGFTDRPSATQLVRFVDEHAFGETAEQVAWLSRYDSVSVGSDDGILLTTLFVAQKRSSGAVLCAFTSPAPIWARPGEATWSVEERQGWVMRPAGSAQRQSSVLDVLTEAGLRDLDKAGQVIIRPRYCETSALEGQPPPGEVWVVEILGKVALERNGHRFTTDVYVFRDGDLKGVLGSWAP